MIARLEFDLDDVMDEERFRDCVKGTALRCALDSVVQEMRSKLKHGDLSDEANQVLEEIYFFACDALEGAESL